MEKRFILFVIFSSGGILLANTSEDEEEKLHQYFTHPFDPGLLKLL